jgi:uncharacterized protein (TIGR03435 family)
MMKPLLLLLLVACLRTEAQTPPARSFEVASIKLSTWPGQAYFEGFAAGGKNCGRANLKLDGRRVTLTRATICGLIRMAYGLQSYQVLGAPKWMMEAVPGVYFDIDALAEEAPKSANDALELLRPLLAERFGLKFHSETRELPVYALTIAKGGPKLSKSEIPCGTKEWQGAYRGDASCKPVTTLAQIAAQLTPEVDRPIIDRTGLEGPFAYSLAWLPEEAQAVPGSPPGLFTAIQEQLGLKLEPIKAEVEVLVIDAVTKPTQN